MNSTRLRMAWGFVFLVGLCCWKTLTGMEEVAQGTRELFREFVKRKIGEQVSLRRKYFEVVHGISMKRNQVKQRKRDMKKIRPAKDEREELIVLALCNWKREIIEEMEIEIAQEGRLKAQILVKMQRVKKEIASARAMITNIDKARREAAEEARN